ncbi:MAG: hypothetical protein U0R17_01145 [Acidimicrobiia bacterium]
MKFGENMGLFFRRSNGSHTQSTLQAIRDEIETRDPNELVIPESAKVTLKDKIDIDEVAGNRIIIPRTNIEVIMLLRSFGSEIVAEVEKADHIPGEHYQVMTLPEGLSISRGRLSKPGEYKCLEGNEYNAYLPGIIRSPDGQVVVAFFETVSGPIQLVGPTWANLVEMFPTDSHIPLLPDTVTNVTSPDAHLPQSDDWELFMMGIDDFGHYPVKVKCMRDLARANKISSSSRELADKFEQVCGLINKYHEDIALIRGRNLQEFLAGLDRPAANVLEM